jgi:hypothetical protein
MVKADVKERMRRYSFLVMAGVSMIAFYLFVPPTGSLFAVVEIAGHRGVYNSAWVGASIAMATTPLLFLLGFYLIKGTVDNDARCGVGQLIASSPLSRRTYLATKFLSNLALLATLLQISFFSAILMQLIRGESSVVSLKHLLLPFLVVALPSVIVVSALAVLFESVGFLRGGLGNVLYFLLWIVVLTTDTGRVLQLAAGHIPVYSLMGNGIFRESMAGVARQLLSDPSVRVADGLMLLQEPLKTFLWPGVEWTLGLAVGRLPWLMLAGALVFLASLLFRGFDTQSTPGKRARLRNRHKETTLADDTGDNLSYGTATSLSPVSYQPGLTDLVKHETRLLLKGLPWWWYAVQLSLTGMCLLAPLGLAQRVFAPLAWSWPLLIWSALGHAEYRHRTADLLYSCPGAASRRTVASWAAGLVIALLAGSGFFIRLLALGLWRELLAFLVGAMFVPALASTLGTWTRSGKFFEVTYIFMMYLIFNGVPAADFMGAVADSAASGATIYYLSATGALLLMTYFLRRMVALK